MRPWMDWIGWSIEACRLRMAVITDRRVAGLVGIADYDLPHAAEQAGLVRLGVIGVSAYECAANQPRSRGRADL
jgi:hypothetical protein